MDVAVYVRISTDKQELNNQLSQLKLYSKLKHYNIVRVYKDIISGSQDSRPEFDSLFKDARKTG